MRVPRDKPALLSAETSIQQGAAREFRGIPRVLENSGPFHSFTPAHWHKPLHSPAGISSYSRPRGSQNSVSSGPSFVLCTRSSHFFPSHPRNSGEHNPPNTTTRQKCFLCLRHRPFEKRVVGPSSTHTNETSGNALYASSTVFRPVAWLAPLNTRIRKDASLEPDFLRRRPPK